jgi:hypothetical protein
VTDPIVLTATKSTGKFGDISPSYQFQVRSGSTVIYDSGVTGGGGAGNNVTHTVPSSALAADTDYSWRVRSQFQNQNSSWSSDGTFKSPVGAFIRGSEVRDPLTIGRTVGENPRAPCTFTCERRQAARAREPHLYRLPVTLRPASSR